MTEIIKLSGGQIHFSAENSVYKIKDGTVFVYIIPSESSKNGRRLFLCEVRSGMTVPSLYYKSDDKIWRFGFVAAESAEIIREDGAADGETTENFAKYINLKNYYIEGFEEGIAELYRLNNIKEDAFVHSTSMEQERFREGGLNLIDGVFKKAKSRFYNKREANCVYKASERLCEYLNIPIADYSKIKKGCDAVDVYSIARISHFLARDIMLGDGWYKKDLGAVLVYSADGESVFACIPRTGGGYAAYDPQSGESVNVNSEFAQKLGLGAVMFYRPFENKSLSVSDLIKFGLAAVQKIDLIKIFICTLIGALVGLLIPVLTQKIYDVFIPSGEKAALIRFCFAITAFIMGNTAFSVVKNLISFGTASCVSYSAQSAAYDRIFGFRESFYGGYDSADLAMRTMNVGNITKDITEGILSGAAVLVMCVVYGVRMFAYSPNLSRISFLMILIYAALYVWICLTAVKYRKSENELTGKVNSTLYQMITGVSKIRTASAEDAALYEYIKPYTAFRKAVIKGDRLELLSASLSVLADGVFTVVLYGIMIKSPEISVGTFMAFVSLFGMFSASVMSLADKAELFTSLKPRYERIKPVLENVPEFEDGTEMPGDLSGEIELNNIRFGYDDKPVLDGINLHIRSGEYIGIVGPSGCGKSTLFKLLLGFEKPQSGKIFYDSRDMESMDKRELRKSLGVVLQDGGLIPGSIYENITITAPNITYNRVKEIAAAVGLEKDIDEMAMGLHTLIGDESATLSGGQIQRILIARAIAANPKILLFDEATSALDNITQTKVCKSLDSMNVTRVVIAHRLSTVIGCDRIIVLNNGKIEEEGTFEQLMKEDGYFKKTAERQII